ncbi:MAG: leucine-rich repeat domain-containing protein [Euryarchaeota archaeon]|nr:leucine-rich repeat domain-containing protein [Euryarchaeota archaeon]
MNRKSMIVLIIIGMITILSIETVHAQEEVTIPDETLEAILRGEIGKPKGPIYKDDLKVVTRIAATEQGIQSLEGLQYCVNLRGADLRWNEISYIPDLSTLDELEYLQLDGNLISDISGLLSLGNIKALHIGGNGITDISPLANLTTLERLEIGGSEISDISPLANLINLEELWLFDNNISDLSPITNLTNVRELILSKNDISDISPLSSLTSLQELDLAMNNISNISALSDPPQIEELYIFDNNITDISPLMNNPRIDSGDTIFLDHNPLSKQSIEEYIPALEERGVEVMWNSGEYEESVETTPPESPTGTTPPEPASSSLMSSPPQKDNTPLYLGVVGILVALVLVVYFVRKGKT